MRGGEGEREEKEGERERGREEEGERKGERKGEREREREMRGEREGEREGEAIFPRNNGWVLLTCGSSWIKRKKEKRKEKQTPKWS